MDKNRYTDTNVIIKPNCTCKSTDFSIMYELKKTIQSGYNISGFNMSHIC